MAYDFGSGLSAGLGGAGTGFSIGGPIGAGIGGVLGLFSGLRGNPKKSTSGKDSRGQFQTLSPEQSAFLKNIYKTGGVPQSPLYGQTESYLQNILSNDPSAFEAFEAPYKEQFEQETIPMIANRFAGYGTGSGGLKSSSLNQALAQAGRGLSTDLASLRSGLQMQALPQAMDFANQPLRNQLSALSISPFENTYTPRQPGILDYLAQLLPFALKAFTGSGSSETPSKPNLPPPNTKPAPR